MKLLFLFIALSISHFAFANFCESSFGRAIVSELTPEQIRDLSNRTYSLNKWQQQAEDLLERPLNATEVDALNQAHLVGQGEIGKDGQNFAGIGNYTQAQIREKARTLRAEDFTSHEIRLLMEEGIVGLRSWLGLKTPEQKKQEKNKKLIQTLLKQQSHDQILELAHKSEFFEIIVTDVITQQNEFAYQVYQKLLTYPVKSHVAGVLLYVNIQNIIHRPLAIEELILIAENKHQLSRSTRVRGATARIFAAIAEQQNHPFREQALEALNHLSLEQGYNSINI